MTKKMNSWILSVVICIIATFCLGNKGCTTKSSEYCAKAYSSKTDRQQCTKYCRDHYPLKKGDKAFNQGQRNKANACQGGQYGFLTSTLTLEESNTQCAEHERLRDQPQLIAACQEGVSQEFLRSSKTPRGKGRSGDRENGMSPIKNP